MYAKEVLIGMMTVAVLAACSSGEQHQDQPRNTAADTLADRTEKHLSEETIQNESDEKRETTQELSTEDKVMEVVWKLDEVQRLNNTIRKKSGGKRGISTFISSEPSDDQEYYTVSVAEDNGSAMATYYQFYVYPDFSIRFYDVVEDRELTLDEWRATTETH